MNLENITLDPSVYIGIAIIPVLMIVTAIIQSIKLHKRRIVIGIQEETILELQKAIFKKNTLDMKIEIQIEYLIARNKALSEVGEQAIERIKILTNGRKKV